MHFDQAEYDLKCEWGREGLRALQATSDVVVIVDVLSFSTAVDIAVSNGASVLPFRWNDESAERFAEEKMRVSRRNAARSESTHSYPFPFAQFLRNADWYCLHRTAVVLCFGTTSLPAFTACLRNASAVAKRARARGSRISVIPAGEQWIDGSPVLV